MNELLINKFNLDSLIISAKKGNIESIYLLSSYYLNKCDYQEALNWLKIGIKNNDQANKYLLKAKKYLLKAIDLDHTNSLYDSSVLKFKEKCNTSN